MLEEKHQVKRCGLLEYCNVLSFHIVPLFIIYDLIAIVFAIANEISREVSAISQKTIPAVLITGDRLRILNYRNITGIGISHSA